MDEVRNYTLDVYCTIFYKMKYSSYKSSRTQFEMYKNCVGLKKFKILTNLRLNQISATNISYSKVCSI